MFDTIKFFAQAAIADTKATIADRKGVTALEYGVIAAAIIAILIVTFNIIGGKLKVMLQGIDSQLT